MIEKSRLKDAERIVRLTMVIILLTASTSKFFSHGGFYAYYSALFQGGLRIKLPPALVNTYLAIIPFIELTLGLALLSNQYKNHIVYGWFIFIFSLMIGHYILQEWSSVNEMLDYIFLGLLTRIFHKLTRALTCLLINMKDFAQSGV